MISVEQYFGKFVVVHIAAGHDQSNSFALQHFLFFNGSRQRRRPCPLHCVVGIGEVDFHGAAHFIVAHQHDPLYVLTNDLDWLIIGNPARHSVGDHCRDRSLNLPPCFKRQRIRRCAFGNNPDDFRFQAHSIAHRGARADPRPHADRNVHDIQVRHRREQLNPITGDSLDDIAMVDGNHVQVLIFSQLGSVLARLLKVFPKLDQLCSLRPHGRVLLGAVAERNHNSDRNLKPLSRQRHRLSVVAARRGNQPFDPVLLTKYLSRVHHRRARLKRANRRVVLMLDPHVRTQPLVQQRPGDLRCRRHHGINQFLRFADFVQLRQEGHRCTLELLMNNAALRMKKTCQQIVRTRRMWRSRSSRPPNMVGVSPEEKSYPFSTRTSPSLVCSSIETPPPLIFPRTAFSWLDPDVVIGKSTFTEPSPLWALMSAAKLSGKASRIFPSPDRKDQPACTFCEALTLASILPSPVRRFTMSNRPSTSMLPSCVFACSRPSASWMRMFPSLVSS